MLTDIFPLNANVWGTVSDWTMIVVTIVTAFFLYKTLQSQIKVQMAQKRISEIEDYKFRESIKPVFELEIKSHEKIVSEKMFILWPQFKLKNGAANNLKAVMIYEFFDIEKPLVVLTNEIEVNEFVKFSPFKIKGNLAQIKSKDSTSVKSIAIIYLKLFFNDIEGYNYSQSFKISMITNDIEFDKTPPVKLITNV